jgi:hypothetical protein
MITDLDSWLHDLESEDLIAVSDLQPSQPMNVIDLSNDHDSPSTEIKIMIDVTATPAAAEDVS